MVCQFFKFVDFAGIAMWLLKGGYVAHNCAFPNLPVSQLSTVQSRFTADGHPYPRGARTPPIASQTEGDIAAFPAFNYEAQLH